MSNEELLLASLTRIEAAMRRLEDKADGHSERIAKLEAKFEANGYVRISTCKATKDALTTNLNDFKKEVRAKMTEIGARQWTMWAKVAGMAAIAAAAGIAF